MSRAEYMREYRAKRSKAEREAAVKAIELVGVETSEGDVAVILGQAELIAALEAEVKHLKAELAKRLIVAPGVSKVSLPIERFNSRPFTPAPKHR